jgi:ADP-ribose pyrophosphatase YjhB (NUDIX family)
MTKHDKDYPFTLEEFHEIYGKVPRLTVEVVLKSNRGVLLSLRDIEPCKGLWHLPGGTVFFGEKLTDAVQRVAKRELGVDVTGTKLLGYIEYPSHYETGLDCPVGIAFLADYRGEIKPNEEAAKLEWFKQLPSNMHPDQNEFINSKVLTR